MMAMKKTLKHRQIDGEREGVGVIDIDKNILGESMKITLRKVATIVISYSSESYHIYMSYSSSSIRTNTNSLQACMCTSLKHKT